MTLNLNCWLCRVDSHKSFCSILLEYGPDGETHKRHDLTGLCECGRLTLLFITSRWRLMGRMVTSSVQASQFTLEIQTCFQVIGWQSDGVWPHGKCRCTCTQEDRLYSRHLWTETKLKITIQITTSFFASFKKSQRGQVVSFYSSSFCCCCGFLWTCTDGRRTWRSSQMSVQSLWTWRHILIPDVKEIRLKSHPDVVYIWEEP